jgi:hypothetical protein
MPTARQTQANRRAAALSTGPNLPQGKTISITNGIPTAVRHETQSSSPHDNFPTNHGRPKE